MSLLATLLGEVRRRALGISAEEIRFTIEDVRAEIRSVRAELKADLARLRQDLGVAPAPEDGGDDDLPEAKA